MNVRQYGINTNEQLYHQHQNYQRKKEQLKERYEQEITQKNCTFKPQINKDFDEKLRRQQELAKI
jgi:hypothetical protein